MFNNTVGKAASTITGGATQNVGNILNGKGNIGDLLNMGMFAGTGGLGSLANIGKWQTGDFLNFLPYILGGGQGQPNAGGFQIPGGLGDMAKQLSEADFMSLLMRMPMRNAALDRAYQGLSESGTRATANSLGNQVQARGAEAGRANANSLLGRGYGSSVADSARLQGRNQGVQQANNISMSLLSPSAQAQNALTQANIYSPGNLQGGGLNALFGLQNASNSQRNQDLNYYNSKPASGLESFASILGLLGPSIFGGSSGMKSAPTSSQANVPMPGLNSFGQGVNNTLSGYNTKPNYGIDSKKFFGF